jgi:hypothetical protein
MAKTSRPPFGGGNVRSCHRSAAIDEFSAQNNDVKSTATAVALWFFINSPWDKKLVMRSFQ